MHAGKVPKRYTGLCIAQLIKMKRNLVYYSVCLFKLSCCCSKTCNSLLLCIIETVMYCSNG